MTTIKTALRRFFTPSRCYTVTAVSSLDGLQIVFTLDARSDDHARRQAAAVLDAPEYTLISVSRA